MSQSPDMRAFQTARVDQAIEQDVDPVTGDTSIVTGTSRLAVDHQQAVLIFDWEQ